MHPLKPITKITCRSSTWTRSLSLAGFAALSLASYAFAQKIENPSFEADTLNGSTPFVTDGHAAALAPTWAFGLLTGICVQGTAYAEKLDAADGSQVAFLQGDPSQLADQPANVPKCLFGTDITGLSVGSEYEIQWAEASRSSDSSNGALTVIISNTDGTAPQIIVANQPVENKGEWKVQKHSFTATNETMRINIAHSIPDLAGGAHASESTLLDDFRIRKVQ